MSLAFPLSDLALSRRLELCEAHANALLVEARARLEPHLGAAWLARAGAMAMFDGIGSPLTQTFALGIMETPSDDDLAALETFFRDRGAGVFHEVSPMASPETIQRLVARGYRPVELTSILYRPLARETREAGPIRTRIIAPEEVDVWAATAALGWSEYPELGAFMDGLARITATSAGSSPFLAELDGRAVATGALLMHGGVALLAGASTIPEARNRGAQRALLEYATAKGCDLAMMAASPGSTSQRNAERRGFRIAYTRIKWERKR
jgi:hypothetical protein